MNLKRIAIIGAGPSGLVAAKECLEAGMDPVVFEAAKGLGGVWNPEHGKTWRGMDSLLSQFHMGFSDFPFVCERDFPSNTDVFRYLTDYAEAFKLTPHIRYEQKIISAEYSDKDWRISTAQDSENFDGVIMASGVFAKPYIPPLKHVANYQGRIHHSDDYKHADTFKNRRVAVIGGSYSGYEIAADLAQNGVEVAHVFRTPSWIAGRYTGSAPFDLISYAYKPPVDPETEKENWLKKLKYLETVFGNPGYAHPALYMDPHSGAPANIIIADNYIPSVHDGMIKPYRDQIVQLQKNGITTAMGKDIQCDDIIFCTGYQSDVPLHDSVASMMQYNAKDMFQPLVLNKNTLHPDIPSLAFTGLYRGPYFGVMEMQARWASAVFSGQCPARDKEAQQKELDKELGFRNMPAPRPAFPRPDYTGLMLELAKEIGAIPHELLNSGVAMIPADFRRHGIGAKPVLAWQERTRMQQRLEQ